MRTNKLVGCGVVALMALAGGPACGHSLRVELLQDEGWWGGATKLGTKAPYGLKAKALSFDISRFNYENQVAPLMLSTLNEYRACFKMGGQPLVQRLCDKGHDWKAVRQLVPDMIQAGLLGHSFVCPDMIGGGSWMAFAPDAPTPFDPEIFVRSAQAHALAPMMQFSAAPWRLLKGEHLEAVRAAAWLRMKWTPYIVETAKDCAKSGEPMLRAMEYEFPGLGAASVTDQFMLGTRLLVAPQTEKGAMMRKVFVPTGLWTADDGTTVTGPATVEVSTPLSRLPHFVRNES